MTSRNLILPFFCPICKNLVFLLNTVEPDEKRVLDYYHSSWRVHACVEIHKATYWDYPYLSTLSNIKWGVSSIPLSLDRKSLKPLKTENSVAIITSLPVEAKGDDFASALSLNNTFLKLRLPSSTSAVSAGMLLNIKDIIRVGKNRYRMKEIVPVEISLPSLDEKTPLNEYCLVTLSARDPFFLDAFVDRFLKNMLVDQLRPLSITPGKNEYEESSTQYYREIAIYPERNIIKKLEVFNVPDSVRISVNQVIL